MISSKTENYTISKDMLAKIDSLRSASHSASTKFTAEQDEIIKKYYYEKNKEDLAELLGICVSSLRKRHRELIKNG